MKIHLKGPAILAGLVGAAMGAAVLVPGVAMAQVSNPPKGQFQGGLTLAPASGNGTVVPSYTAAHACPTGTVQAVIEMIDNAGIGQQTSAPVDGLIATTPGFQGVFNLDMNTNWLVSGATSQETFEFVVDCQSAPGQIGTYTDATLVTFSAGGNSWTSSSTPPAGATDTTTSLTAPSQVQVGGNVTLNASVTPSTAAGTVGFFDGATSLGAPVNVTNGAAQFSTTSLTAGSHSITAKFTPTDPTAFKASTSSAKTVTITSGNVQGETINVNVPSSEGVFTMSVSQTPVQMTDAQLSADNTTFESTGQLGAVTISDGRNQSRPGWQVSGQVGDFTSGANTINGSSLGWSPKITTQNAAQDVVAGASIAAGTVPGLKQGGGLASAAVNKGLGTSVLGADLDLKFPSNTKPGAYSATLTVTAVQSAS